MKIQAKSFLQLPSEIRQLIYKSTFEDGVIIIKDKSKNDFSVDCSRLHADVLGTCKEVREEGYSVYNRAKIQLAFRSHLVGHCSLRRIVATMPLPLRHRIKTIVYSYPDQLGLTWDLLDLMQLQHLQLAQWQPCHFDENFEDRILLIWLRSHLQCKFNRRPVFINELRFKESAQQVLAITLTLKFWMPTKSSTSPNMLMEVVACAKTLAIISLSKTPVWQALNIHGAAVVTYGETKWVFKL